MYLLQLQRHVRLDGLFLMRAVVMIARLASTRIYRTNTPVFHVTPNTQPHKSHPHPGITVHVSTKISSIEVDRQFYCVPPLKRKREAFHFCNFFPICCSMKVIVVKF